MSRFYVCEAKPYLRIYDKKDGIIEVINNRKFKEIIDSGLEVDGLASNSYELSEESIEFSRKFKAEYLKELLSTNMSSDRRTRYLYSFDFKKNHLGLVLSHYELCDDFTVRFALKYNDSKVGSKELYIYVILDNFIKTSFKVDCCDEFICSLEKGVTDRDGEYVNHLIKSYYSSFSSFVDFLNVSMIGKTNRIEIGLLDNVKRFPTFNDIFGTYAEILDVWIPINKAF